MLTQVPVEKRVHTCKLDRRQEEFIPVSLLRVGNGGFVGNERRYHGHLAFKNLRTLSLWAFFAQCDTQVNVCVHYTTLHNSLIFCIRVFRRRVRSGEVVVPLLGSKRQSKPA